jgi:hypothetical protein
MKESRFASVEGVVENGYEKVGVIDSSNGSFFSFWLRDKKGAI